MNYQQQYYNNNKIKFRNYYLNKRMEKIKESNELNNIKEVDVIDEMKKKLINCCIVIRPNNKKKRKSSAITLQHGDFIVNWD